MTTETEKRFVQFRQTGDGTIAGTAIRYGDVAKIGRFSETFEPGSLEIDPDVIVNLQHDRGKPVARTGSGLTLTNDRSQLHASISLPDTVHAREAKELVAAGILRGMSVEFTDVQDRWEGSSRTITRARLTGIGLVDRPAYSDSQLEARWAKAASQATGRPRRALL